MPATEVFLTSHDDETIAGPQPLVGFGRQDGLVVAQDGHHGHAGTATDLELGDRTISARRVRSQRDPIDQQTADDGLDVCDNRGLEVRAAKHRTESAGLIVRQ